MIGVFNLVKLFFGKGRKYSLGILFPEEVCLVNLRLIGFLIMQAVEFWVLSVVVRRGSFALKVRTVDMK